MLSCRTIAYLITSDGLEGSSWLTRLRVRFHLLHCKHCHRHTAEIETIGNVSRDTWNIASVDTATMHRLEQGILDEAFGGSDDHPSEPPGS